MKVLSGLLSVAACVHGDMDDASLLQQHSLKKRDAPDANLAFAIQELGPFPLASVSIDFETLNMRHGRWKTSTMTKKGKLATTMAMNCRGSSYWLGATSAYWAYPPKVEPSGDSVRQFETYGGFILLDDDGQVTHTLEISKDDTNAAMTIYFDDPFGITEAEWSGCKNPSRVTIQSLREAGARQYCWETKHHMCQRGCYFYKTTKGFQAFAVKDFPIPSLGAFPLRGRDDLISDSLWSADGAYAAHEEADKLGSEFWLGAHYVNWVYNNGNAGIREDGVGDFGTFGGFVLADQDGKVQKVLELDSTSSQPELTLQFGEPFHVSPDNWAACAGKAPITLSLLHSAGAQEYCWHVGTEECHRGCFYYKTTSGYQGFAVKPYAMESLGPFKMQSRKDLESDVQIKENDYAIVGGQRLKLAATMIPTGIKCPYGGPTCRVRWAYQAPHVTLDSNLGGSFEKYGGFIIEEEGYGTAIFEIGDEASDGCTLIFSTAFHITKAEFDKCSNPARITLEGLSAQNYCYHVDVATCKLGCYYYKTTDGYQGFAVTEIMPPAIAPQ